ncbi:hypothetical protein E2C01_056042 [Portunus trituberculatus]|uniref:Uncharacterized protein n=1 Tax=Portunus trituberculatus TaxID=210409 RepID=A0A5B7GWB9_PORTR|nr:hypothetical protein [Portunus trituberculatus]
MRVAGAGVEASRVSPRGSECRPQQSGPSRCAVHLEVKVIHHKAGTGLSDALRDSLARRPAAGRKHAAQTRDR